MTTIRIWETKGGQVLLAALLLLGIHYASNELSRDWKAWAISVPALLIIMITAIARTQDIKGSDLRSFVRRIGLILAGAGGFSLLMAPVLGYSNSFPSWRAVTLYWGFAFTWLTTPHMPPWWKYVSGEWRPKGGRDV